MNILKILRGNHCILLRTNLSEEACEKRKTTLFFEKITHPLLKSKPTWYIMVDKLGEECVFLLRKRMNRKGLIRPFRKRL